MKFGRTPEPAEPGLIAALAEARETLLRTEAEASAAVAAARGQVVAAQGRVDEFRVGLVRDHAAALRQHATRLRQDAEDAGDETIVVAVQRFLGQGGSDAEPTLRYKRVVLAEEAVAADAKADWLDGYLQRGHALQGDVLAVLVGELEPLPETAATVAA